MKRLFWLYVPQLCLAGATAFSIVAAFSASPPVPEPRRPCTKTVAGPSPLYYCADAHAWQLLRGRWIDAGVITAPGAEVPLG